MNKKLLSRSILGIATAALTAAVAGCSTSGDTNGGELLLWHGYSAGTETLFQELVDEYNATDPDVPVGNVQYITGETTTQIVSGIRSGEAPNLFVGDGNPSQLGQIIATDEIVALDDHLADSETTAADDFYPGMLSAGVFDDVTYSLPTDGGDYALIYNREMFAEAGLEPPTTWDEVREAAAALTDPGSGRYGIYLPMSNDEWPVFTWQSMLWSAGGEFLSEDNTEVAFDSDEGVEALSIWTDLVADGYAYPTNLASDADGQAMSAFTSQSVAMIVTGAYNLSLLDEALGTETVGVTAFPVVDEPAMNTGVNVSYILESTDALEQGAWEFLEWWTSPDVQSRWAAGSGYLPTTAAATEAEATQEAVAADERLQVFLDELEYASSRPSILSYGEVSGALSAEIEKAMLGQQTPQQALENAADAAQEALDGER
ncbi:ABC transporter substrate-binding protein [Microbacterium betulae]|uniref:ABC transporter substrate-binding protein n=1 Tax=Microbacterium betulae TaxID=2981139 RepID=A0AA97FJH3_9MICO|nr:ABC transporter substrate-binding protein [Microbacterium sp. AB]WOF23184.1 ABC transporter substrate-binding protein [Microbacterium sp. AB]